MTTSNYIKRQFKADDLNDFKILDEPDKFIIPKETWFDMVEQAGKVNFLNKKIEDLKNELRRKDEIIDDYKFGRRLRLTQLYQIGKLDTGVLL